MESNQLGPGVGPGGVEVGEEALWRSRLFLIYGWRLLKSRRNGINSVWKSCREEKPKCWAGAFAGGHRPEIQAVEDRAGDEWCRERNGTEKAGMSHPSLKDSCGSVLQTLPAPKALQPAVGLTSRLFPGYSFSHPGFVSPLLPEAEATF